MNCGYSSLKALPLLAALFLLIKVKVKTKSKTRMFGIPILCKRTAYSSEEENVELKKNKEGKKKKEKESS